MHAVLIFISLLLAWILRFEFRMPDMLLLLSVAPVLIGLRLAALGRFGLLHGYWRYAGVHEVAEIAKALGLGSVSFFVTTRYLLDLKAFPLSIYCLESILTTVLVLGMRVAPRLVTRHRKSNQGGTNRRRAQRVFIAGAGFAAQLLIRELKQSGGCWEVVGCVDDDQNKIGSRIHGVPVLGTIEQFPALSAAYRAFELLIAIPSATAAQMQRIVEICDGVGVRYKTVPSLRDFAAGQPSMQQLREVNLEDLLGRDPVKLDLEPVCLKLRGAGVLVTGAAGSIGSELVAQILQCQPRVIVCLDQDESGLFELQQRLGNVATTTRIEFCIADIADRRRMPFVLSRYGVDTVFHAAAYKHVSLTERNVCEVLKNNVFGLISMLNAADRARCTGFVLISSDKAVNPTSFMGCTKRIGELILAARPVTAMRCVTVRFGNVLGSQGSVIPLFQRQIRMKNQITVTHPDVTRYFMTIPESVALVLQAFVIGEHGDLLVLDMGKPLRIVDLARTLMKLSGVRETEAKIEFTGLRPGEKLHEELFYEYEEQRTTPVAKILLARSAATSWTTLVGHLNALRRMVADESHLEMRDEVRKMVPEYVCPADGLSVQPSPIEPAEMEPCTIGAHQSRALSADLLPPPKEVPWRAK